MVPGLPCVHRGNWGRERGIVPLCQNSVFCDDSSAKFMSLVHVFQIHFAVLAIANSFRKLCLTA